MSCGSNSCKKTLMTKDDRTKTGKLDSHGINNSQMPEIPHGGQREWDICCKVVTSQISAFTEPVQVKKKGRKRRKKNGNRSHWIEVTLCWKQISYMFVALKGRLYGISPLMLLELASLIQRSIWDTLHMNHMINPFVSLVEDFTGILTAVSNWGGRQGGNLDFQ